MIFQGRVLGGVVFLVFCVAFFAGIATPAAAQYDWEAVVGGGATLGNGFGDADNQGIGAMAMFNGRLFAASSHHSGLTFQLWWTDDGTSWTKHADDGFGDANNLGVLAMAVFDGNLYAATVNNTAGAQIYRTANGTDWTRVANNGIMNANNNAVICLAVHDGQLFAGTENQVEGGQIYRTSNGTLWYPVVVDGFGLPANRAVASLQSYGGRLYAGTYKDSTLKNLPAELWRTQDLVNWESKWADGFGDSYNMAYPSMAVYDGYLFVGTTQLNVVFGAGCEVWRWDGVDLHSPQQVGTGGFGSKTSVSATRFFQFGGDLLVGVENPGGGKLMRFQGILSWDTLVADGFGNVNNVATFGGATFNGSLYVGTTNLTQGAEVYRSSGASIFSDSFESGNTDAWSGTVG